MSGAQAAAETRDLRRRAELALRQQRTGPVATRLTAQQQLHELQVHQIELEMQNEALRLAQADAEAAHRQLAEYNARLEQLVAQRTTELVAARDAAEASALAKSDFLSHMSHELRTPLSGVMGMIDLALKRASDPGQADWLDKAKTSARHLLTVVDDVLDIAKSSAGRLQLRQVDFQLAELIREAVAFLVPAMAEKGLGFTLDLAAELQPMVLRGDSFRLKQVLLNLLGNAVKFTPAGEVALQVRVLQHTPTGLLLRFEVRDTGIGIALPDQERLFAPFAQINPSPSRHTSGTGLGLDISARLVRLMGGDIGVDSTPGQGSRFWFTALLGRADQRAPAHP